MSILAAFALGLVFGLGLILAGMSDPAKVLNFLDLAAIPGGDWDPSLAFVMAGAIAVTLPGYRWVWARGRPIFDTRFHLPEARRLEPRIWQGAAIFGIGWGLAGFCPGPALTALATGGAGAWLFFLAMLAGMAAARHLAERRAARG